MIVEYRTWTAIADVPFSDEPKWMSLTEHLEREHAELGPVASWKDDWTTLVLVLANDEPNAATAAEHAARIVSEALHAVGLTDRFATVYEVEPAPELIAAA